MGETAGQAGRARAIRIGWCAAMVVAIGFVVASVPWYGQLRTLGSSASGASFGEQLLTLLGLGLSLSATITSLALAALLFWKKGNDRMGVFLSFFLIWYGIVLCGPLEAVLEYWSPEHYDLALQIQGTVFLIPLVVLILIFPNGHFSPRWTRWLVIVVSGLTVVMLSFFPGDVAKLDTLRVQVLMCGVILVMISAFGTQLYRYRHLYSQVERQQTKWVMYGTGVWIGLLVLVGGPYIYLANLPPDAMLPWWNALDNAGWWLALNVLPLTFTVAILRSHLWDIDILIRRTVTYSLVTVMLLFVYFACVILLQRLLRPVTGSDQSGIVTVLSTLALAALFVPLRNRVQDVIDRRFNRKKYDAQRVLEQFAETVRDETDLGKLSNELAAVVSETMQPKSVSVWLRRESGNR